MSSYKYRFYDLLSLASTPKLIADLPLTGVSFSSQLDAAGSFSATLPLGDPKIENLDWRSALQESRTAIFVDRDGVLVWGGILWTTSRSHASSNISLGAKEFWSYFGRRYIIATQNYSNVDQLRIAAAIINAAQAQGAGNIGVTVPAVTSGILRTYNLPADQFTVVSDAVQTIAALVQGFDFAIDVVYSGSPAIPTLNLNLSYPGRGRTVGTSGLTFAMPGNIIDHTFPTDGTSLTTTTYALGSGAGPAMLRASASAPSLLDAGYPLLETANPYKSVLNQSALEAQAEADIDVLSLPVITGTITVRADGDPVFGSYIVGDEARVQITDATYPSPLGQPAGTPGLDSPFRIVAWSVTPPDSGVHENVVLSLGVAQ